VTLRRVNHILKPLSNRDYFSSLLGPDDGPEGVKIGRVDLENANPADVFWHDVLSCP